MEASNAITTLAIATTNDYATSNDGKNVDAKLGNKQLKKGKKRSKRGGQTNVWKAALLFFLGRRKATKAIQAQVVSDANNWTMLVGCMRPMNLQGNESTLMLPDASSTEVMNEEVSVKEMTVVGKQHEEEEDVNKFQAVITPLSPSSSSSLSECSDSRYASALNLQELDKSGSNDDDESEEFDDTQGDAMIDMKAEMFIAQFYAQMRIDENTSSA
uniref:Uncharacterized protein n=1 Tax=Kalanchoe fedtschenkoi TaxID=63787 RepID=A0A7N0SZ60_KALFE